jgi:hypothetical protein
MQSYDQLLCAMNCCPHTTADDVSGWQSILKEQDMSSLSTITMVLLSNITPCSLSNCHMQTASVQSYAAG